MCLPCRSPLLSSYSLSSILTHSFSSLFFDTLIDTKYSPEGNAKISNCIRTRSRKYYLDARKSKNVGRQRVFVLFFHFFLLLFEKKKSISVFYFIFAIGWARFKRIFFVSYLKIFARCCQWIIQVSTMFLSSNFYISDRNIEHNLWYVDNQDIFYVLL